MKSLMYLVRCRMAIRHRCLCGPPNAAANVGCGCRRLLRNAMRFQYRGRMCQTCKNLQSSVTHKPKYVSLLGSRCITGGRARNTIV